MVARLPLLLLRSLPPQLVTREDNLGPLACLGLEDTDAWVLCRVRHLETIHSGLEYAIWLLLLKSQSGLWLSLSQSGTVRALDGQVHGWLGDH